MRPSSSTNADPVALGQECGPREDVVDGVNEPGRAVDEQVAEQPRERVERLRSLVVAARVAEPERRCVAATEHDVVLLELGDDLVGLAQELGEGTFDNSHVRDNI